MVVTDRSINKSFVGIMAAIIVIVAALDQLVKALMLNILADEPIYLIGHWFRLRLLFNPGAAFSLGENSTWLFTTIQIGFVLAVIVYARKVTDMWSAVALALIAGGALGNLIDRLFRQPGFFFGHVVDYISVGSFAVFNIADAAITCGVIVFIIAIVKEERRARAA
ncbi:signal peptidase II [Corynebacterium kutscheri]